jgi:hypothetical protein
MTAQFSDRRARRARKEILETFAPDPERGSRGFALFAPRNPLSGFVVPP